MFLKIPIDDEVFLLGWFHLVIQFGCFLNNFLRHSRLVSRHSRQSSKVQMRTTCKRRGPNRQSLLANGRSYETTASSWSPLLSFSVYLSSDAATDAAAGQLLAYCIPQISSGSSIFVPTHVMASLCCQCASWYHTHIFWMTTSNGLFWICTGFDLSDSSFDDFDLERFQLKRVQFTRSWFYFER